MTWRQLSIRVSSAALTLLACVAVATLLVCAVFAIFFLILTLAAYA